MALGQRKLWNTLLALPLLAIVPLAALSVLVMLELSRAQQRQLYNSVQATAAALAAVADETIAGSIRRLELLGSESSLDQQAWPQFYQRSQKYVAARKDWSAIVMMRLPDYRHVINTRLPYGSALPLAGETAHLKEAAELRRPVLSDLFVGRVAQHPIINLVVPVIHAGEVRYVLTATLEPLALSEILRDKMGGREGIAGIVDAKGTIVARSREAETFIGKRPVAALDEAVQRSPEGSGRFPVADRQGETYSAWAPIGTTGWRLIYGIPAEPVDTALWRSLGWFAAAFALVLAGSGIVAWRVGRKLTSAEEERARLLEAEKAARGEAEAASKAKDEFLAMLSHELRNPLAAISNAAYVLKLSELPASARQAHEAIMRQTAQLARIVDDLLDVSRVVSGKIALDRRAVDLHRVVQDAIATVQGSSAAAKARIVLEGMPTWVHGDAARLEQVAQNLIANAVKFTPPQGMITVRVKPHDGEAMLEVADTGKGIRRELLPRVFDLFVQDEADRARSRGGLGIGLTLARRLVEMHGGAIEAASEGADRGATFTVRLPLAARPESAGVRVPTAARAGALDILVVEDNADAGQLLVQALQLEGHDVRWARDGASALALVRERLPHACVIDIGLPKMDGVELGRRLRGAFGEGVILFALSGYGQDGDLRRTREAGFDRHFVKPIDPGTLLESLAQLVRPASRAGDLRAHG